MSNIYLLSNQQVSNIYLLHNRRVSNQNCDFKLTDRDESCTRCINDTELATHQRILENTHQTWKTFNWKYEEALFRIRESYVRN